VTAPDEVVDSLEEDDEPHIPAQSMSYAEFGSAFVHEAVTPERITAVIRNIAGDAVRVGPMHAGPAGVAIANAVGTINDAHVTKTGDEPLAYAVALPVDLSLDVTVAGTKHHFDVDAIVQVRFRVVLAPPLSICIEPESPTYRDVEVTVHPRGMRARVVGQAGNIDRELRKQIARYLRERITTEVSGFSEVDLLPLMKNVADQLTG
jgi:hypothetical protein